MAEEYLMLLQGRIPATEKEAPPQATHGAAQTFPPWGLSWEMALKLPGKAFQGQGSLKDTRLMDGCSIPPPLPPTMLSQEEACKWRPVAGNSSHLGMMVGKT